MLPTDKSKLYYLATPYSHEQESVKRLRGIIAEMLGAKLVHLGYHIFGPIAESSQYTKYYSIEGGWEFWKQHDEMMISKCDGLIVIRMKGMEQSTGVKAEIKHAQKLNLAIHYVHITDLLPELGEIG